MTYDEALYNSLVDLGYTGSSSDMYRQFLEDRLTAIGAGSYPAISDMLRIWLEDLGYTGTIQEMLNEYAVAAGYSNHIEHVLSGDFTATDYAYQLDGVTQSFVFSADLSLTTSNWKITQEVYVTNAAYVFGNSTTFNSRVSIVADGSISVRTVQNTAAMSLPVGTFNSYKNMWTTIELEKVGPALTLRANGNLLGSTSINSADTMLINRIGQNNTGYTDARHRNFNVYQTGVLTNTISLTNKSQGSTQLATVGTINATIQNYTSGGWVQA